MNPLERAVVAAVLAVLVSAPTVLGAWKQGSTTCPPTKYVYVYSKASVEVYHYWSGNYRYYYNPYRRYREDNTRLAATWWTIEYDFEIEYGGGYCGSI
jgi:hypothetical protein